MINIARIHSIDPRVENETETSSQRDFRREYSLNRTLYAADVNMASSKLQLVLLSLLCFSLFSLSKSEEEFQIEVQDVGDKELRAMVQENRYVLVFFCEKFSVFISSFSVFHFYHYNHSSWQLAFWFMGFDCMHCNWPDLRVQCATELNHMPCVTVIISNLFSSSLYLTGEFELINWWILLWISPPSLSPFGVHAFHLMPTCIMLHMTKRKNIKLNLLNMCHKIKYACMTCLTCVNLLLQWRSFPFFRLHF